MRLFPALIACAALCGCGQSPREHERATPALATFALSPERVRIERRLDGVIEAVNQGTVAAQTSGRVEQIFYDVNDLVPAGAVIVRLRATEQRSGLQRAEAALREATAVETEARARFTRISDMYDRRLVAKAALDEATATRDAAVARLAAARAALESAREGVAYTEIRAPYAGIVTKRHVEVGETVAPGTLIMSGLSLEYLRVSVDIPQSIVDQVRRIKQAAVYVGERRIEATHLTVFPEASTPSNTFRARLELPPNVADLYPGMFVKVGFVIGETQRILVPQSALIERAEVTGAYVVGPDGRISLRQVRAGNRIDGRVEILAGLRAGDRVASDPIAAMNGLSPSAAP